MTLMLTRRRFLALTAGASCAPWLGVAKEAVTQIPPHLTGYEELFSQDPRAASVQWFRDARFGMFIHWNVKANEEGKRHWSHFNADGFDAHAIVDTAIAAEMKYITFTSYHSGGPHMWNTATVKTNSYALAGRDIVGELSSACAARGLGYFNYMHISSNRSNDERWDRVQTAYKELLGNYGPIAGLWMDSVHDYYRNRHYYPKLSEQYALARSLQPHLLIGFCEGATGEEDYVTMEHRMRPLRNKRLEGAPIEICTTLQEDAETGRGQSHWFDNKPNARRRTPDDVIAYLARTASYNANLLLNTGLRGDGSLHPVDETTLRKTGRRLREEGWPAPQKT